MVQEPVCTKRVCEKGTSIATYHHQSPSVAGDRLALSVLAFWEAGVQPTVGVYSSHKNDLKSWKIRRNVYTPVNFQHRIIEYGP